jgi:hypothetical protein
LVSTISFSGVARMGYSLLGNNVLKDHRCPTLRFVKGGIGRCLSLGISCLPEKTLAPRVY